MVPRGRKRRDSALVGARVPGVRRPGDKGAGELAAGWARGHNRRRRARRGPRGPREQPRRAEPSLAGTGTRWAVGSRARAGRPSGRWEALGFGGVVGRVRRGAAGRALFPRRWRGVGPASGSSSPLPRQMAWLSGCLPVCRGAGEMMSPRRTWNQSEGTFLASFCHSGFWTGCVLFSGDESSSFQG